MRKLNTVVAVALCGALMAATASPASADWHGRGYYGGHYGGHYYGHGGPGLVGGVVIGALTLATLPFAILGAAVAPPPPPPPPYYGPPPYAYGPRPYGPPPPPGYYNGY